MDVVEKYLKVLRNKLDKVPIMQQAEEKTRVKKEFLAVGGVLVLLSVMIFGVGIASLSNIVGFLYPAFKSFQALESKTKGDDTQWLSYWVIFSFFTVIEHFVDMILYWIPFYYAFKLAFLLWAMLPQTKGAKFLYDSFLKDFLKKNESKIDAAMADAKKHADSMASDFASATKDASNKAQSETKKAS